jgi:hypothetical protein
MNFKTFWDPKLFKRRGLCIYNDQKTSDAANRFTGKNGKKLWIAQKRDGSDPTVHRVNPENWTEEAIAHFYGLEEKWDKKGLPFSPGYVVLSQTTSQSWNKSHREQVRGYQKKYIEKKKKKEEEKKKKKEERRKKKEERKKEKEKKEALKNKEKEKKSLREKVVAATVEEDGTGEDSDDDLVPDVYDEFDDEGYKPFYNAQFQGETLKITRDGRVFRCEDDTFLGIYNEDTTTIDNNSSSEEDEDIEDSFASDDSEGEKEPNRLNDDERNKIFNHAESVKDVSTQVDNPVTIDREFLIKIINDQSQTINKQSALIKELEHRKEKNRIANRKYKKDKKRQLRYLSMQLFTALNRK